jgi:hypothetical protein
MQICLLGNGSCLGLTAQVLGFLLGLALSSWGHDVAATRVCWWNEGGESRMEECTSSSRAGCKMEQSWTNFPRERSSGKSGFNLRRERGLQFCIFLWMGWRGGLVVPGRISLSPVTYRNVPHFYSHLGFFCSTSPQSKPEDFFLDRGAPGMAV